MTAKEINLDEVQREYVGLVGALASNVRIVQLLPLSEMAQVNERMQTLAPMLEPTAYMRHGSDNLRDQRRVIDAALALKLVLDEIAAKAGQ